MMNKNYFITLFGTAIILFLFQAMSWMVLPIHTNSFKISPQEDTILNALQGLEEGVYMMPGHSQDMSNEEMEKMDREMEGKPWAQVTYHKKWETGMGPAMARGLVFNIISVCIVLFMVSKIGSKQQSFFSKFLIVFLFGVFIMFQENLMNWNWMGTPLHYAVPEMIDSLVGWSLCGAFIAWFYKPE